MVTRTWYNRDCCKAGRHLPEGKSGAATRRVRVFLKEVSVPVSRKTQEQDIFGVGMGEGLVRTGLVASKIAATHRGQQWTVEGSNGHTYTVRRHEVDGGWTCTCPAFGYGRGVECKHIIKVKEEEGPFNTPQDKVNRGM